MSQGYVNLRCAWVIGCPGEIHINETDEFFRTSIVFRDAYSELFPEMVREGKIPEVVGVTCCAQFAVSAAKVRERPRSDYERYRNWLLRTPLDDATSGRVLEYSWHSKSFNIADLIRADSQPKSLVIFGKPAVFCPAAKDCYCRVFGLCELANCSEGECKGQYTLPKYANKPPGWKPLRVFEPDLWENNASKSS